MIFFVTALVLLFRLHRFQDPTGADGYFYLKQIQDVSEHLAFYYKDYSLGFALPTLLNALLHNPLLSYQVACCLVFAGLAWLTDRLAVAEFGSRWQLWVFRAAELGALCYSNLFFELNLVFLKTATAVLFLLAACECLRTTRLKTAAAFALLAILSHKLMLFILPLGFLLWMAPRAVQMAWRQVLGVVFSVGFGSLAIYFVYPRVVAHAAHLFAGMNYAKLSVSGFYDRPAETCWLMLFSFAAVVLITRRKALASFAAVICLLPVVFPDAVNSNGVSYRLMLIAFPFFLVGLGLLWQGRMKPVSAALMLSALALGIYFNRGLVTWVSPWSERIPHPELLTTVLPADALLYAPHGAEFYLAYKTPFRPRSFINPTVSENTFRVAYVKPYLATGSLLENDLQQANLANIGDGFFVLKETQWLALSVIHMLRPHAMNLLDPRPDFIAEY